MADIYEMHDKAFSRVAAYVVLRERKLVARIAVKFPADGAGRLQAFVHWLGQPMVRGTAGGYGYDKASAAVAAAAKKLSRDEEDQFAWEAFQNAAALDDGYSWQRNLTSAGFDVLQAV